MCFTFYSSRDPENSSESDEVDLFIAIYYFQLQFGCELRPVKVSC
jgi:hypothetical protein